MAQTTGTLSAASQSVVLTKKQTKWYCVIDVDGTYTGLELAVSGSIDGENYTPLGVVDRTLFTLAGNGQLTGLSTRKTLEMNGGGFRKVKLTCSAISTGSASVVMKAMMSGTMAKIAPLSVQAKQTVMGGATAIPATAADFTASPLDPTTFDEVTFTYTGGLSVATYLWDFGDGDTSTSSSPSHTYDTADTSSPSLTVTLTAGGTASKTNEDYITVTEWTPADLGVLLTDNWASGANLYQDSGATTPVTAAGQTVAAWVGVNGTKLTTTGGTMKALSVRGILTPVSVSDDEASWVVPGTVSVDARDFAAWLHCQAGSGWSGGYVGLGSDRGYEMSTYQETRVNTYNATGGIKFSSFAPFASPMALALEGAATTRYIRRNASSYDATVPLPAGTVTGGFLGSLNDAGSSIEKNCAIYHGLTLTKGLDSTNRGLLLSYYDGRVTRPSDTTPSLNLVSLDDSNTCGTGAGGVSWPWLWVAADYTVRIVSSSKSGRFFSAGGSPVNGATNSTNIDAQYLAGAGRNIIIIADTNDFSALSAAAALSNREAWAATRQAEGWEVWQPYMPIRVAPYTDAAAYTAVVQSFNTLLASSTAFDARPDLYAAFGGASPPGGTFTADGIHWSAATQSLVYATLLAAL